MATPLAGWIGRCQVSVFGIASKCIFPFRIALGELLGCKDESGNKEEGHTITDEGIVWPSLF